MQNNLQIKIYQTVINDSYTIKRNQQMQRIDIIQKMNEEHAAEYFKYALKTDK